ncbi:alpha/beta hydrolase [Flavobacterium supellecticarium]|uniref:Alpha/beta hydrolase n=1 Tax=Flavobacterium supellecticarium TaxID=2565924 RepID=A0A4S3ZXW5_9FLAO|nr:alpha/beta hydrolase [Flavobacterium supellecticarium]THF50443.1 alpha/beta hydrolase [Flavobacterium supellecticarium]
MMKNAILTLFLLFNLSFGFAQQQAFDVKVIGKGQPILLIPGYSCSGAVWNETADHLKNNYQLHILTLAGFAGVKPIQDPVLQTVHDQLIQYIKTNKLKKPMLIGHSLGAFMALWVSSSQPDLFGKIVCVDGVPFISALTKPETTVASLKDDPRFNKEAVINNFKSIPNDNYVANMTQMMLYQVRDTARAKQIAEWSFASDRTTLGSTIVEMSLTDLRTDIAKIKSPVLILTSIFNTKENSEKIYNEQYAALKNKTIKVADSKHFIMYDAPEWFYSAIDNFLNQK